ncbi:MAG: SRPBCC family protein [Calditrichaeota bacterium]|nr:MAG: SRPBCC family protein [Calditrichota bacterium]
MVRISIIRKIESTVENVFNTISNITNFSKAVPEIVDFEILSEIKSGLGMRFSETRITNKKKMVTELEITEFVKNDHVRMVADSHGTVWDTLFEVKQENGNTVLKVTMDAKAHKLLSKLLNPLMKGLFRKGVAKNLDDVKKYCER